MVEESEIVNRLREILRKSDLNTTTAGAVRRQLESDFGVDLSDRKRFISKLIDDIIQEEDGDEEDKDKEDDDNDDGEEEATTSPRSNSLEDDEEEEEEEEAEEEETPKKKKRGGGFTKVCGLSPSLQDFLQVSEMARTEVVKKLWAYIRDNNLQDPSNRRNILCDDNLRSIFRVDKINMFQMNKVLSKHIWPLESSDEPPPQKKQKRPIEDDDTDVQKTKGKSKLHKGGTSGFLMPLQLSETFVKFLGTGETTLSRAEAVKRIWGYIKQNDLQDPSDKRQILCDEKLKELFEVDTFHGFSMSKYLKAHLSKVEQ